MTGFPTASTQYNDMEGEAVIDWHGGGELSKFAEAYGIDTSRYLPVTIDVYGLDSPLMDLYCVDRDVAGTGMDVINEYAREHGEVPVVKFKITAGFSELQKYVKRFSVVVTNRSLESKQFRIVEEQDLD